MEKENLEKMAGEEDVDKLKEKSREMLEKDKEFMKQFKETAMHKMHYMQKKADYLRRQAEGYAKDNVWKTVGIAALTGFVVGLLVGKKGK